MFLKLIQLQNINLTRNVIKHKMIFVKTRPSVNYAKDWLDHSFLFPGLVWSEKEFNFGCDH